jgi:hypothetical protein
LPAITSAGRAETAVTVPQLKVFAVTKAAPVSGVGELHCRVTETFVVDRATVLKVAEPVQVTVLSVDAPERVMR